jgi:hypothetical protein
MDLMMMERVGDRWEKLEGSCLTGQRPQWAVVPVEEEEEEQEEQEQEEEEEEEMSLPSCFRRGVNEIFALLAFYVAWIGSYRRFVTTNRSHLELNAPGR